MTTDGQNQSAPPLEPRRVPNWIQAFGEWSLPRTPAPISYVFWAGIFSIACVLKRRVYISEKYLGNWNCYPHLYLTFVGPPGILKTTTMVNFAHRLLEQVPTLKQGPDFFTKELLTKQIIEAPDASVYLMVPEFADLMQKNGPELYDFLTSMYDARNRLEVGTMMRGIEVASKPSINMFSATTPAWIAGNMSQSVMGGGYASRVIFVLEKAMREKKLFYKKDMIPADFLRLENDLVVDLNRIAMLEGEFDIDDDALDWMEDWNKTYKPSNDDPRLQSYFARKTTMVLKLAMISSVARDDVLNIELNDFKNAVEWLGGIEAKLPEVFGGMGKNEFVFDMKAIVGYVLRNLRVSRHDMLQMFGAVATPAKVEELIQGCLNMRLIKAEMSVDENKVDTVYYIPGERSVKFTPDTLEG